MSAFSPSDSPAPVHQLKIYTCLVPLPLVFSLVLPELPVELELLFDALPQAVRKSATSATDEAASIRRIRMTSPPFVLTHGRRFA
ncbi:hypothetical protein [Alicyclobacillus herbarius]|uniref:hypothetical protein n=1 Tax=Alicyclobacillus herbarius TaxID=122960 RepID=UPI00040132CC|nr:hypothetical protein [Alicyclobacillus herbarius]